MQVIISDGTATCVAAAELTVTFIQKIIEDIEKALCGRDDFSTVCVDLSKTQIIDSIGLTFLIGLYKTYSSQGKKIKLTGYNDALLGIFKIMRFDELFDLSK
jgi:anti-anti-sigma factor